jgi:predicted metal-dependent TIM-barrel fold hydrolase
MSTLNIPFAKYKKAHVTDLPVQIHTPDTKDLHSIKEIVTNIMIDSNFERIPRFIKPVNPKTKQTLRGINDPSPIRFLGNYSR